MSIAQVKFVNDCQAAIGAVVLDGKDSQRILSRLIRRALAPQSGLIERVVTMEIIKGFAARGYLDVGTTVALLSRMIHCSLGQPRNERRNIGRTNVFRSPMPLIVRKARRLVTTEHASPDISLQWVADRVHVSRWHLARLLVRHTGHGFVWHLHQARIRASKELLKTSDMSVKAVSLAVGYRQVSEFDRHFRQSEHMTPGEYRTRSDDPGRQSSTSGDSLQS